MRAAIMLVVAFFLGLLNIFYQMISFLLPANIQIYCTDNHIIIQYKDKLFIKKNDKAVKFNVLKTSEGDRLFASAHLKAQASSALSIRYNLVFGLSCGYQQRLRLVGIGFRAVINTLAYSSGSDLALNKVKINAKNYIQHRFEFDSNNKLNYISIKLGYSHETTYPINQGVEFNVSAIDGRSKGIIIDLKSSDYSLINKIAVEIRSFRYPDAYKGKGIFYNKEVAKLKKGKRQG
jgi:large subunit ribosomal protein L6